jgi:hypothetical protein
MDFNGAGATSGQNLPQNSTAGIVLGVYIPFTSLSLLFVCVRLYTRAVLLRFIGKDDGTSFIFDFESPWNLEAAESNRAPMLTSSSVDYRCLGKRFR